MTNQSTKANDYAVASDLNEKIIHIILVALVAYRDDSIKALNMGELNRSYVLLAAELQRIYDRIPELSSIKPEPIWQRIDMLINTLKDLNDSFTARKDDIGTTHNARVHKLHILSGEKEPEFSTDQMKLIEDYEKVMKEFSIQVEEIDNAKLPLQITGWKIDGYSLKYKPDGSILINEVLKLKKIHAGSITEKLLEQAIKNPNIEFKPELGKTARNISTIISSAGFTPVLRDLFFPAVGNDAVVFRPWVSREQADRERIDTEQLDNQLRDLGAWTILIRE